MDQGPCALCFSGRSIPVHARFNHWVDQVAQRTVLQLVENLVFRDLSSTFRTMVSMARDLASFQAGVGMMFAGEHDAPTMTPLAPVLDIFPMEPVKKVRIVETVMPPTPPTDFCSALVQWLGGLSFSSRVEVVPHGALSDMVWVEPFWCFVCVTASPVLYCPSGITVTGFPWGTAPLFNLFCLPSFVDALLSSGVLLAPWCSCKVKVTRLPLLGSRFTGAGFAGRVLVPLACVQEFIVQLCAAPRISALRLPAVVN